MSGIEQRLTQLETTISDLTLKNQSLQSQLNNSTITNNTVTLDVNSLRILERSSASKPSKFNGYNFNKWYERLKFYLKQLDEDKYLDLDSPMGLDLDKSRKTAQRILELLDDKIRDAYFSNTIDSSSLCKNLVSDFGSKSNDLRVNTQQLFRLKLSNFDNKMVFFKEFRLIVAKFKTLNQIMSDELIKEMLISCIGGAMPQLIPFYDSLNYGELISRAESMLFRFNSKPSSHDLNLLTAEQKRKYETDFRRKSGPNKSKYFKKKNNQHLNQQNNANNSQLNQQNQLVQSQNSSDQSLQNNRVNNRSRNQSQSINNTSNTNNQNSSTRVNHLQLVTYVLSSIDDFIPDKNTWIIDGGSSSHICLYLDMFKSIDLKAGLDESVISGNKASCKVMGIGEVDLILNNGVFITLNNVKYVPDYISNIFCLNDTTKYEWLIKNNQMFLIHGSGESIYLGSRKYPHRLFTLDLNCSNVCINSTINHDNTHLNKHIAKSMEIPIESCDPCSKNNLRRTIPKEANFKSIHPLELIHIDLMDRLVTGIRQYKYCMVIVDDFSRCYWSFPLQKKYQAYAKFRDWYSRARVISRNSCRIIRTDNGTEFVNNKFKRFCESLNIWHQTTVVNSSFQNGVAERAIQYIQRTTSKFLDNTELPRSYWPFAIYHASIMHNKLKLPRLNGSTPEELFGMNKDNRLYLKFGCKIYFMDPKVIKKNNSKKPGYYLTLTCDQKGYYVLDILSQQVKVVHDIVEVDQNVFDHVQDESSIESSYASFDDQDELSLILDDLNSIEISDNNNLQQIDDLNSSSTSSADDDGEFYEIDYHLIPKSYNSISKLPNPQIWYEAVERELQSYESKNVWSPIEIENEMHILPCHFVFNLKHSLNGPIPKARLVIGGNRQNDQEYYSTFAPTSSYDIYRFLIAMSIQLDWRVRTADVKTAFLNSPINENIFVKPPKHLKMSNKLCLKLNKSAYGLKQGAADWYRTLSNFIISVGFEQSIKQPCLFFRSDIIITIYVDDLFICAKSDDLIDKVFSEIGSLFDLNINQSPVFLGMQISINSEFAYLSGTSYIESVAKRWNCVDRTNYINNPLPAKRSNLDYSKGKMVDLTSAKSLFGQLSHIMRLSRPDISFAICLVGRFISKPTTKIMNVMYQILRFLYKTRNSALRYDRETVLDISIFADASFATAPDGRSYTGYVVLINKTAVFWSSEIQSVCAQHINEAELFAVNSACKTTIYLIQIIDEVFNVVVKPLVLTDSTGVCTVAENGLTKLTKYVSNKQTFIKDLVDKDLVTLKHCYSGDNAADGYTKRLNDTQFEQFYYGLGFVDD